MLHPDAIAIPVLHGGTQNPPPSLNGHGVPAASGREGGPQGRNEIEITYA